MKNSKVHEKLAEQLRLKSLKVTPFRVELLQVLSSVNSPLSSSQILQKLKGGDRATLFRNLKSMEAAGLLLSSEFGRGAMFYELVKDSHEHHMFCVKCESLEPIDHCGVQPLVERARRKGFHVLSHRLELLGLCSRCA